MKIAHRQSLTTAGLEKPQAQSCPLITQPQLRRSLSIDEHNIYSANNNQIIKVYNFT